MPGCAPAARRRTRFAPASSRCSRWPPNPWNGPRCCRTCERRLPPGPAASTTTRSGNRGWWRRARPRWHCGWPPSSRTRIRYSTPATAIEIATGGCAIETASGERFHCDAVVSAVPVGPLRRISIDGVSPERLGSLDRQRHALAAKACFSYPDSFWERNGLNGTAYMETTMIGGTWPQREGIISALIPPERLAAFLATSPRIVEARAHRGDGRRVRRGGGRSDRRPHPALGGRPVDRGLHHRLAPRRRDGGRARCTALTSRPSTSVVRTSGCAATWRAPSARAERPPPRRSVGPDSAG